LVHVAHISAGLLRGAAREGQDPRLSNLHGGVMKSLKSLPYPL
jgi:hypothetical protein